MEQYSIFEFFEDVIDVPITRRPKQLHCPICDYYFNNNPDFYKFCHICGSRYEVGDI